MSDSAVTPEITEQHDLLDLPPLDSKVLETVRSDPELKIKPARLASELGISIEDATAELCGLLRAVGSTATFTFETVELPNSNIDTNSAQSSQFVTSTMVFQFPPDFERRARSSQRKEDVQKILFNILYLAIKILKVVVAFGLIVSLVILLVAGMCATIALIIGLSRGGGGRNSQRLTNQVRSMFFSLRQILWCYAIFGEGLDRGQDPFLRETAHTMTLALNMLLGSPRSIWFWMNARSLNRRHRRRGWRMGGEFMTGEVTNQGSWRRQELQETRAQRSALYDVGERGILSVAVEFLFGPTPFQPGPSEYQKWKMRERVIVSLSSTAQNEGISLAQLLPYIDHPPRKNDVGDRISSTSNATSECLGIVSHFNGIPTKSNGSSDAKGALNARFVFPELISEAVSGTLHNDACRQDEDGSSWESFLFLSDGANGGNRLTNSTLGDNNLSQSHLIEKRHVLTKLTRKQFGQCFILNILNYIGILMLWKAIEKGGVLELQNSALFGAANTVLSVLIFYAKLFFAIPLVRGCVIIALNLYIDERNERRHFFSQQC